MLRTRQTAVRQVLSGRQDDADLGRADFGHIAANSLFGGIAVFDSEGVVRWTNQSWPHTGTAIPVIARTRVGTDLHTLAAADAGSLSVAIIGAITAVLAGGTSYVELHSRADGGRPVKLAITPLRGGRGGVVLHAESIGSRAVQTGAPLVIDAARIAERLTPRELDVLTRMAEGLSNRAIASELGIEYTTVRGYVQSVLSKLGARSRFDAVARAYRSGLVRETES